MNIKLGIVLGEHYNGTFFTENRQVVKSNPLPWMLMDEYLRIRVNNILSPFLLALKNVEDTAEMFDSLCICYTISIFSMEKIIYSKIFWLNIRVLCIARDKFIRKRMILD